MKFLLLGKGQTIRYIKKFLKSKKQDIIHCVFPYELKHNYYLADDEILKINDIDYALKSPGINETNEIYIKYSNKFKFISEADLLAVFNIKLKIIGVTGSNGKTTLVDMITFYLNNSNIKAISCGNSHKSLFYYYKSFNKYEYFVMELSSYMLKDHRLHPFYISCITNLSENHLDGSKSISSYYNSKKNIYRYNNHYGYFIKAANLAINDEIENTNTIIAYPIYSNDIRENISKYKTQINILYTIAILLNISNNFIKIINKFNTLPFREEQHYHDGVTYINDSKSTSIESLMFALSHVKKDKTILIVGGKDKKLQYDKINKIKVKYIISYGEISKYIYKSIQVNSLKDAVMIANAICLKDKIILFSPATSSYDQFKNFEARGKYFNYLIRKL